MPDKTQITTYPKNDRTGEFVQIMLPLIHQCSEKCKYKYIRGIKCGLNLKYSGGKCNRFEKMEEHAGIKIGKISDDIWEFSETNDILLNRDETVIPDSKIHVIYLFPQIGSPMVMDLETKANMSTIMSHESKGGFTRHDLLSLIQKTYKERTKKKEEVIEYYGYGNCIACKKEYTSISNVYNTDISKTEAYDQCTICLDNYMSDMPTDESEIRKLVCKHKYHKKCIDAWLKDNEYCPICPRDKQLSITCTNCRAGEIDYEYIGSKLPSKYKSKFGLSSTDLTIDSIIESSDTDKMCNINQIWLEKIHYNPFSKIVILEINKIPYVEPS